MDDIPFSAVKPSSPSSRSFMGLKETRLLAFRITRYLPCSDNAYVEPSIDTKAVNEGWRVVEIPETGAPLYRDTWVGDPMSVMFMIVRPLSLLIPAYVAVPIWNVAI